NGVEFLKFGEIFDGDGTLPPVEAGAGQKLNSRAGTESRGGPSGFELNAFIGVVERQREELAPRGIVLEGKSSGGAMGVGVEVRIGVAEVGFQESVPIRGVEGVRRVEFAGANIGGVEIADGR